MQTVVRTTQDYANVIGSIQLYKEMMLLFDANHFTFHAAASELSFIVNNTAKTIAKKTRFRTPMASVGTGAALATVRSCQVGSFLSLLALEDMDVFLLWVIVACLALFEPEFCIYFSLQLRVSISDRLHWGSLYSVELLYLTKMRDKAIRDVGGQFCMAH